MKRLSLIFTAILMGVSCLASAQDAAPVMYIPGMPVPQTSAAPAASEGDVEAAPAQDNGKISRITKAGDMYKQPAAVPEDEETPAVAANVFYICRFFAVCGKYICK